MEEMGYNETIETWKDIQGYEGYYQVSNHGRVRSMDRYVHTEINGVERRIVPGRILKINQKAVYKKVHLRKDGKGKSYFVHRLVAEAFIPNPNDYPVVNHMDENPENNRVENLEWCTQKHNMNWNGVIKRKVAPKLKKSEEEKKRNREAYLERNAERRKEMYHNYYLKHRKKTA